jgi:hypothetical protein
MLWKLVYLKIKIPCIQLFSPYPLRQDLSRGMERLNHYSETCEIRTPFGQAVSVPNSDVSSFHRAFCTENSILGPDQVSLFHRMSSFRRVAIHRFHCTSLSTTLHILSPSLTQTHFCCHPPNTHHKSITTETNGTCTAFSQKRMVERFQDYGITVATRLQTQVNKS